MGLRGKVGGKWQFDDGTPVPDVCPSSMSTGPTEVHLRAKVSTDLSCRDDENSAPYHYSCEYLR